MPARTYRVLKCARDDVIAYLKQHQHFQTLSTFKQELKQQHMSSSLCVKQLYNKIFSQGSNHLREQDFQNWISSLKGISLPLQFYLRIWFCIDSQHGTIKATKMGMLKEFIEKHGDELSKHSQLLHYFVLPYTYQPQEHPFLRAMFTSQWKKQVQSMLVNELTNNQSQGSRSSQKKKQFKEETLYSEAEWLNIVADLVSITQQIAAYIPQKHANANLEQMLHRVKQYSTVIQQLRPPPLQEGNTKSKLNEHHSSPTKRRSSTKRRSPARRVSTQQHSETERRSPAKKPSAQKVRTVSPKILEKYKSPEKLRHKQEEQELSWKNLLAQLSNLATMDQSLQQPENPEHLIAIIFHKLTVNMKEQSLKSIIRHDFLGNITAISLVTEQHYPEGCVLNRHIGYYQLLNSICCYYAGRRYLVSDPTFILPLYQDLTHLLQGSTTTPDYSLQKLTQILKIFQKTSITSKGLQFLKQKHFITNQIPTLLRHSDEAILIYALAITLNISLHVSGRKLATSNYALFDRLVWFVDAMMNGTQKYSVETEDLIFSLMYILLLEDSMVARAEQLNLKDKMLERMLQLNQQHFNTKVQYIIKRMQRQEEDIPEDESDTDREDDDQNDVDKDSHSVWVARQPIMLQERTWEAIFQKIKLLTAPQPQQSPKTEESPLYQKQNYRPKINQHRPS